MKETQEFSITKHARNRLRERFPEVMGPIDAEEQTALRVKKMYELLYNATSEKRFLNDTRFMQYIHERYGYEKAYKFFANGNILFIGVVTPNTKYIATVLSRNDHISNHLRPEVKVLQKKEWSGARRKRQLNRIKPHSNESLETHFSNF